MTRVTKHAVLFGIFLNLAIVGTGLWRLDISPSALSVIGFCFFLAACVVTDLREGLILNIVTYPGALFAMAMAPWTPAGSWWNAFFGLIVIGGALLVFSLVFLEIRGFEGLGMGDVKMGAVMGAYMGWVPATLAIGLGSLLAVFFMTSSLLLGLTKSRTAFPFGPFLAVGGMGALWWIGWI